MGSFDDHLHVRLFVNVILMSVEFIGDMIPTCQFMSREIRLTLDNGVHGLMAAATWLIVIDYRQDRIYRSLYEVLLCGVLGSIVDLDHFLEARSLHIQLVQIGFDDLWKGKLNWETKFCDLKLSACTDQEVDMGLLKQMRAIGARILDDALNLTRRPIFHNTLLLLLFWNILFLLSTLLTSKKLWRFSWILLAAGLSHHLRDGIKHGLLLDPLGSTPVLPYWSYILATALLPYAIRLAIRIFKIPRRKKDEQSLDTIAPTGEKNEKF